MSNARMQIGSVVAATAVCACSVGIVPVDLPEAEGMHALIVGVEQDDLRMFAIDLDRPVTEQPLPTGRGSARLYAFYYQQTLDALGYPATELRPDPNGVPVDPYDRAFVKDVGKSDTFPDWVPSDVTADQLPFRIAKPPPNRDHCPAFDVSIHTLGTSERFYAAVAMGDEVLAFGRLGTILRVTTASVTELPTSSTAFDVRSAAPAPNGDVWLGSGSRVLRGHPTRGYKIAFQHPTDVMQWMDGPGTDSDELFVLTAGGELIRGSNDSWVSVARVEAIATEERFGDVVWLSENRAAMFPAGTETFVSYDRGEVALTFSEHTVFDKFAALSRTGDDRVALMTRNGVVLEVLDDALIKSTTHDFGFEVYSMSAIRSGFIYARTEFIPTYGELGKIDCVGEPPGLPSHVATKVVAIGDVAFVFGASTGVHDEGEEPSVVMIVRLSDRVP